MSKVRHFFRLIFGCFFLLFLGCGKSSRSIALLTDKAELAPYIELFNSEQSNYKLEMVYSENPALELTSKKRKADLVISKNIANYSMSTNFLALNRLFNQQDINTNDFYIQLLNSGIFESSQKFIPVNFTIPVILFNKSNLKELTPDNALAIDSIREMGSSYNSKTKEKYTRMGFSPLWNYAFVYYTLVLFGSSFQVTAAEQIEFNENALKTGLEFINNWVLEINGRLDSQLYFQEKYINIPDYQLLNKKRILFYVSSVAEFLKIPAEKRENLDFRWLSYNTIIPVADNVYYAGILRESQNKSGAFVFLSWFFRKETQKRLLGLNQEFGLAENYGLANGFSSLIAINELELAQTELLRQRVPDQKNLLFPKTLPINWEQLKQTKLYPAVLAFLNGSRGISAQLFSQ